MRYIVNMRKNMSVLPSSKLAIAYIRASKESQKLTPEAQRAAIEAWAVHEGVQVVEWHIDQDVCSVEPIERRPALLAALAACKKHRAGVLIVAKRDRIARKPALTETIELAAAAAGAEVLSADGMSSRKGVEGVMLRGMSDLFAQVEREMIRTRTKAALAVKKARGERVGQIPYGWELAEDGIHLAPVEAEQSILARAQDLSQGGLSLRKVAAKLTEEGRLSRSGKPFMPTQVVRMLGSSV